MCRLGSTNHFLYFAYGSNLLKRRILINNPSSIFSGIAQLLNYQLDFAKFSQNWQGAVATIVPKEGETVWGAIWSVHNKDLGALDRQEGVASKRYVAKIVDVKTTEGADIKARTYVHTYIPPPLKPGEVLPKNRRPSITYKICIVKGAIESKLPPKYIDKLKKIPCNGKFAKPGIRTLLKL